MATENIYKGIKHVVKISSHISSNCEHCNQTIGSDDFPESINHFIDKHGYKLLHVGQETGEGVQTTVALLGR